MTDIEKEIQEYAKRKRRRTRRLGGSAPKGHGTVPEYARLHQVSINQVYTWIHHGKLDYLKVNGKFYVRLDATIYDTRGEKHGNG